MGGHPDRSSRMRALNWIAVSVLAAAAVFVCPTAVASTCNGGADGVQDGYTVVLTCAEPGDTDESGAQTDTGSPAYLRYQWHSPCLAFSPTDPTEYVDCGIARGCAVSSDRLWELWGLAAADHQWQFVTSECLGAPPTAAQTPQPQITPGLVLSEIRRIGLPKLEVHIQPEGKTLVNFATNFYVTPQPFTLTITLLGRSVEVEATPTQYTWVHGDGTNTTTTDPGAPYPQLDITYAYQQTATVAPSVRVTYQARFRVEGGGWQQIPDTVTVDGPPASLQIVEGTAVLSGDH